MPGKGLDPKLIAWTRRKHRLLPGYKWTQVPVWFPSASVWLHSRPPHLTVRLWRSRGMHVWEGHMSQHVWCVGHLSVSLVSWSMTRPPSLVCSLQFNIAPGHEWMLQLINIDRHLTPLHTQREWHLEWFFCLVATVFLRTAACFYQISPVYLRWVSCTWAPLVVCALLCRLTSSLLLRGRTTWCSRRDALSVLSWGTPATHSTKKIKINKMHSAMLINLNHGQNNNDILMAE